MRENLAGVINRVRAGFTTWPDRAGWQLFAVISVSYALAALGIGFGTGLYAFEPRIEASLLVVAVVAIVVPAFGEEVAFRAAPIPTGKEAPQAWLTVALALAAYVLWYPINAAMFFPQAVTYFSDWRFLLVTALLGLACTILWRRTGSIWPPVLLHWAVVMVWKAFLGAPDTL